MQNMEISFLLVPDGTLIVKKWFHASWVDILKLRISYGSVGNRPFTLSPIRSLFSIF